MQCGEKVLKASHEGLRPQARVGAQPPKAALSAETEAVRKAADEGRRCLYNPSKGYCKNFAPHPASGGASATFPLGGRHSAKLLLRGQHGLAAHVGAQDLGDGDAAIGLQVVLEESDQHTRRGQY